MRRSILFVIVLELLTLAGCRTHEKGSRAEEPLIVEISFSTLNWIAGDPSGFTYSMTVDSVISGTSAKAGELSFTISSGEYNTLLMNELCTGERMHSRDALYAEYLLKPDLEPYRMEVMPDHTFILWKEGGSFRWYSRSVEPQVTLDW